MDERDEYLTMVSSTTFLKGTPQLPLIYPMLAARARYLNIGELEQLFTVIS
ncbi:hypothetical protein [Yersinia alsatica]|uniref:hypothetical protein n=1 Tax=Yersinia alsatica TaxID=2890317 RepID=UPI001643778D|nr:hypothetical protein [Yersinia alsatica]